MNTKWIITIVNTKTFKGDVVVTDFPEKIAEIEATLDEDEAMYVNELKGNE